MRAGSGSPRAVGVVRSSAGILTLFVLGYAYVAGGAADGFNPFDYFGYFTNLTSLCTALILIATGLLRLRARTVPPWLVTARAVSVTCMLIVALVYNVLVPGTGSAPPWVSFFLHALLPAALALDWLCIGDRPPLPWRTLWLVLPYPALWVAVVLVRGATDGWVPYGFLLPSHGAGSIALHLVALFGALILAGSLVWLASRFAGFASRGDRPSRGIRTA